MNRDKLRAALWDAGVSSLSGDGPAALLLQGKAHLLTRQEDWAHVQKRGCFAAHTGFPSRSFHVSYRQTRRGAYGNSVCSPAGLFCTKKSGRGLAAKPVLADGDDHRPRMHKLVGSLGRVIIIDGAARRIPPV